MHRTSKLSHKGGGDFCVRPNSVCHCAFNTATLYIASSSLSRVAEAATRSALHRRMRVAARELPRVQSVLRAAGLRLKSVHTGR